MLLVAAPHNCFRYLLHDLLEPNPLYSVARLATMLRNPHCQMWSSVLQKLMLAHSAYCQTTLQTTVDQGGEVNLQHFRLHRNSDHSFSKTPWQTQFDATSISAGFDVYNEVPAKIEKDIARGLEWKYCINSPGSRFVREDLLLLAVHGGRRGAFNYYICCPQTPIFNLIVVGF